MPVKHFIPLRQQMLAAGANQEDLVAATGKQRNYISTRMNAVKPWDAHDMDAIGKLLEIPRSEYYRYFWEGTA